MNFYKYMDIKWDSHFHERYLRVDESMIDSSDESNTFYNENIDRMAAVLAHDRAKNVKQSRATLVAPSPVDGSSASGLSASGSRPTRTSIQSVGGHRASGSIFSAAGPPEGAPGTANGQTPFGPVLEHDLYQPLMKILARVSVHVARKMGDRYNGRCILFQSSYSHQLVDGTGEKRKDTAKKPDLVAVWKRLSDGEALIREATNKVPTSQSRKMTEVVSLLEVKLEEDALPKQVGAYASDIPRGRPDIAGLLFMTCTAETFRFCWSDASRFVCSKSYKWKEDVHLLFYFLHTLYDAVDDLPQLDPTIQLLKEEKNKPTWTVKTANSKLEAVRLFSTPAWGKQTWILQNPFYIIKDLWRDKKRRFTEGAVLKKIHEQGFVPGVVRLRSYEEVEVAKADGSRLKLVTSKKHSKVICRWNSTLGYIDVEDPDPNPDEEDVSNSETKRVGDEVITHDIRDGNSTVESAQPHQEEIECKEAVTARAAPDDGGSAAKDGNAKKVYEKRIPQRVKTRAILDSYGDALEECTSLLDLLKIGFDIVHIHQFCVMKRKSLHRDISKSNVIINPKHNKHPEEKQNSDVGKYIEQVLDPTLKDNVKEIVMLIDWDNAALLDAKLKGPLTDRTGTPMYIARAVSVGAFKFSTFQTRAIFPEISKEAKALYIGAYDQEKYDYYIREINKLPLCIKPKERAPFEHLPYLDMESVFWLFAYLLCRARVGKEDDESNEDYDDFLRIMEQHDPGRAKDDSRDIFLAATELVKWKDRLHPKLQLVAEMLHEMAEYLNVQWAYWKDLIPEDHAHEMMKRLFLNTAVHVRKQGDVRIDLKRARQPLPNPGSVIPSPTSKKSRLNDGTAQGKASVRSKASIHNSREAFTVIQSGADVFGPIQSNDNVGFVDVPQAQSRLLVGEKRRREE